MKKDIEIPLVKDIEIVIVKEFNTDFQQDAWYAYLFNNSNLPIEAVMIVSEAEGIIDGERRKSSLFRHAFPLVSQNQSQKIELLDENIFQLTNTFMLSFFQNGKLFDKKYSFSAGSIGDEKLKDLSFTDKKGITAQ
ncbi:hypothetical protein [Myroides indicus]|uniref:Phenylalanyl-tRNA synthetase subunit alpha n=1 Tax=Myroides indicus TaxID=1323422 RepID=A0A4R7EV87_9FLAO|nr:hypothetical protein [Myroides indicus]TDS57912.1 hypothetical protein C8P70_11445 [Myroides indicus]